MATGGTVRACTHWRKDHRCGEPAVYKVILECTGCKASNREGYMHTCDMCRRELTQGNTKCHGCSKRMTVVSWRVIDPHATARSTVLHIMQQVTASLVSAANVGAAVAPQPTPLAPARSRIGSAQRDNALDCLSEAFSHGFITQDEFEQRSTLVQDAVYDADITTALSELSGVNAVDTRDSVHRGVHGVNRAVVAAFFAGIATAVMMYWFIMIVYIIARLCYDGTRNEERRW